MEKLNKDIIRLFVSDVDSTYNDGIFTYNSEGLMELGRYYTQDSRGLGLLHKFKVCDTMLITSTEERRSLQLIADRIHINYLVEGCKNKLEYLERFLYNFKISWNEVAYIGDDTNDKLCLEKAKFKACPNNSVREIKEIPNIYICPRNGGHGAIRDFIDHLELF